MYCEMCGTQNDDNAKKCKKCGFSFEGSSKNSKEDFSKKTDKFVTENAEVIRKKSAVEVGAKSTAKVVKKIPLFGKIAIVAVLLAVVGFGIYYYITTKNFFVKETDEKGEAYYVYYRDGYKVLNTDLYLRGNKYRVDGDGHRIEDKIYTDDKQNDYYYDKEGILQENKWFELDGEKMHAKKDGIISKNEWVDDYYLDDSGIIARNRQVEDYFVNEDGRRIISEWKNEHYYGEDGKMYRSRRTPDLVKVDKNGNIMLDPTKQVFDQNFRIGSTVVFGEFEQDGDESNGPEPIEWYLLHGHQDEAYLISKKVLFVVPYQIEQYANDTNNPWETSYLKQWLDDYFYKKVFDDIDKRYVLESDYGKVFVPSEHELDLYIPRQWSRMAQPTVVAKKSTEFSKAVDVYAPYWLRDNGVNAMHKKFISDIGEVISDDVSHEVRLTNATFTPSVNAFAGTQTVQDKIISIIVKKYVGEKLPFIGDLINAFGFTDRALEFIGKILGVTGLQEKIANIMSTLGIDINTDPSTVSDSDIEKELIKLFGGSDDIIIKDPIKEIIDNPYIDAGLVTNEFMGVRPMLILDMDANEQYTK